jgi:hypothetical protein
LKHPINFRKFSLNEYTIRRLRGDAFFSCSIPSSKFSSSEIRISSATNRCFSDYLDGEGVILVELSQILEAVSHGVEKGIRSDSASGSTSAQKPILDRILSDVLFLVRFPSEVMELAGRRTS